MAREKTISLVTVDKRILQRHSSQPYLYGHMLYFTGMRHFGSLHITSVADWVEGVIAAAAGCKIQWLTHISHGFIGSDDEVEPEYWNPTTIDFGKDWIDRRNLGEHALKLLRLRPHFAVEATLHFQSCYPGRDPGLLRQISELLGGVKVLGHTGQTKPLWSINTSQLSTLVACNRYECWEQGPWTPKPKRPW